MGTNTVFIIMAASVIAAFFGVYYMNLIRQKREQRRADQLDRQQADLDALLKGIKEDKPQEADK